MVEDKAEVKDVTFLLICSCFVLSEVEFPWFLVVVFGVCGLAVTVISIMLSKQPR